MTPLDLSIAPPRGPEERMLGISFLPRTIDKIRAELPGGKLGTYFVENPFGLSAYVLHKLGVKLDDLRSVVAGASSEAGVEAWLAENADLTARDRINERIATWKVGDMPPPQRAYFDNLYGSHGEPPETKIVAVVIADDAKVGNG